MGRLYLRPLSERNWISGTYVNGARLCGYELKAGINSAAVSEKNDGSALMNNPKE